MASDHRAKAAAELCYPAITLWQPYASLIAVGAKPYETRSWCAPRRFIGKRVAVHAAARKPTRDEIDLLYDDVAVALGFCRWHLRIPYGAIVCTALLLDCRQVTDRVMGRPVLGGDRLLRESREIDDDGFGDYAVGRWCWEMRDIERIDPPVPARGAQGWWTWTP